KKVIVISIMMQSTKQKSNTLQSIIRIFLQSAKLVSRLLETYKSMIVVSDSSISQDPPELDVFLMNTIRDLGQTLLASYTYDNFDVDLKSHVPVAEKLNNSLKHLPSGLIFLLQHGVTVNDLKCSDELWKSQH
ncbi:hypothetical protein BDR03DRAFT_875406, partial [Suillus americanus]